MLHSTVWMPRLGLVLLALAPLLGGCAFLQFNVVVGPHELAILPGDRATVTVTAEPRTFQDPPCDTPGGLCVDVTGQVFDYVVQNLPAGVSHSIDTTLRSPGTPGVVRITFDAAPGTAPGLYSIVINAVLVGHSLGQSVLTLRVLPASSAPVTTAPVAIAAGREFFGDHSVVALADGGVRAWGANPFGQLGDGTRIGRSVPVAVGSLDGIVGVSAGGGHSLALTANGLVWAWGRNWHGQLGDAGAVDRVTPVPVQGIHNVQAIAAGDAHSLALRTDATVWAWGSNLDGQLGDDTRLPRGLPAQVPGLSRIRAIAAGERHSLALDADGTVWAWGANGYGQLGDGTRVRRDAPQPVPGLGGIQAIAAGSVHSLAVAADGTVWAWGGQRVGEFGDGTDSVVPVQVPGLNGIRAVAGGQGHSLALAADGAVWAWGDNFDHQLGDGSRTRRATPVQVPGLSGVQAIAAGNRHSLALLDCGQLWAWGSNDAGQLGDGVRADRPTPVPVPGLADERGCEQVALRVTLAGDGGGVIASSPGNLNCDRLECIAIVDRGTPVILTANPDASSVFERWAVDCQDTTPQTLVNMDASRQCAALVRDAGPEPFLLTVLNGGGLVTSSGGGVLGPDHIDCGRTCNAIFRQGSVVTVSAENANGFRFTGWAFECSGTAPQTAVTMSGHRTCRAEFQPFALAVSVTGSGAVTSDPAGIDCGQTCTFTPRTGTATLTATPAQGWQFDGWSGDCAGAARQASVVVDADKTCAAVFSRIPGLFFLTMMIEGEGSVTSNPAGILCPPTCVALFPAGTPVDLTAHETSTSMVSFWFDDCAAPGGLANQVVMNADKRCRIRFVAPPAFPVAQFTVAPGVPRVGQVVTFDGNASHVFDPGTGTRDLAGIRRFAWNFDNAGAFEVNGIRGSAAIAQHAFQTSGRHEVLLRVEGGPFFPPADRDDSIVEVDVLGPAGALFGLTVNKAGTGDGSIATQPPGLIGCDTSCAGAGPVLLEPGTAVNLVAVAADGSTFAGWTGAGCSSSAADVQVTMDSARTCTAAFTPNQLQVMASATPATIAFGAQSRLDAIVTGGVPPYRFDWSPSASLDGHTARDPLASPSLTTTYSVVVTDSTGASASAMVTVAVLSEALSACFTASRPGAFTVRMDGDCSTGSIVQYRWWRDFRFAGMPPDAVTAAPLSPVLLYEITGPVTLRLEVVDNTGAAVATTQAFTVQ